MLEILKSGKDFKRKLELPDFDLSLIQEAVVLAARHPVLRVFANQSVACVCLLMDGCQAQLFGFDRLYPDVLEIVVEMIDEADAFEGFVNGPGAAGDPIEIEDDP